MDARQREKSGETSASFSRLIKAMDFVGGVMGDFIKSLRRCVKGTVKIFPKVTGPVIRLFLEITDKIVSFDVDTTSSTISGLPYPFEGLFSLLRPSWTAKLLLLSLQEGRGHLQYMPS